MINFIKKNYSKIGMSFALIMLVICWFQQKELNELRAKVQLSAPAVDTTYLGGGDILKAQTIDSLQSELFTQQTIVGRYEVALEMFKEENPKGAEQFQLIMSTKTE